MRSIVIYGLFILFLFADCSVANVNNLKSSLLSKINVNLPNNITINDLHCIKSMPVICIAVGSESVNHQDIPLVIKSTDGGNTWYKQVIKSKPSVGVLQHTSCSWDGSICVASGNTKSMPFIVQSTNLVTWELAVLPPVELIDFITCTGDFQGPLCVAGSATTFLSNGDNARMIQTKDKGISWEQTEFLLGPVCSLTCAGNKKTASCIAYFFWFDPIQGTFQYKYISTYNGGDGWSSGNDDANAPPAVCLQGSFGFHTR